MPELPDVESLRHYLDSTALHQTVRQVEVKSEKILSGITAPQLQSALQGRCLQSTRRHGKYLLARLNQGPWLVLHFGMTGRLEYFQDRQREPPHTRLLITFDTGYRLAYDCLRQLGRVTLTEDAEGFIAQKGLGPDALALDPGTFQERLRRARGPVKAALMNQGLMAGIGNIYSDEILFQAGISPRTRISRLDERAMERLYHSMREVLETAIRCQADAQRMPSSYLILRRHRGGRCPRCGSGLSRVKLSGRTSYYCSECQSDG